MAHVLACKRWPLKKLQHVVSPRLYERNLEHNQQVQSCCRHPENHDIEAWYSSEEQAATGIPDIYKIICTAVHEDSIRPNGERWHQIFCVGGSDPAVPDTRRPFWEVR